MRTFAVAGTGRHGTIRGNKTSGSRNVNRLKESALEPLDVRHEIAPVIDDDVFEKVISGGSLALGESYMDNWWECNALDKFFEKKKDS